MTDAAEIRCLLADRIERLCRELLPNGRLKNDPWRVGGLDGAAGGSLSIKLRHRPGQWCDFATGEKGDALGLVAGVLDYEISDALAWSRRWLGISPTDGRWRPSSRGEPDIAADTGKAGPEVSVLDDGDKRALASAARYVAEMRPLISAPISMAYFERVRGINVAAVEGVLARTDAIGWHSGVYFNEPGHPLHAQRLGCIVGVMTDAMTAEPTGAISRTYIGPDGAKLGKAKTLGSPPGIVRLSPDDEVLGGLFLAEGLETALSGMAIGLRPMWSTGGRGQMASFPLLDGIEALNVIADHDPSGAGEEAALKVAARWQAAGREVNLYLPEATGDDLNDALRGIP